MCTVTFLPSCDRIYITSNRDELKLRETALLPQIRHFSSGSMLYPEDGRAHGTWMAAHENGNIMVLLNGAFTRHKPNPPYRKSRGLVFLDIFDAQYPSSNLSDMDISGIEPFTLVIWESLQLWEFRWDGAKRYIKPLPADQPILWASATLYDETTIENRKNWFREWLNEHELNNITVEDIVAFHEFGGTGDVRNDLRMNRDGLLLTVSITAAEWQAGNTIMTYKDLQSNLSSVNVIP